MEQLDLTHVVVGVDVLVVQQGKRLRVVPASPGWPQRFVAFPNHLRVCGARFRVSGLRDVSGRYYRAVGPFAPLASDDSPGHG